MPTGKLPPAHPERHALAQLPHGQQWPSVRDPWSDLVNFVLGELRTDLDVAQGWCTLAEVAGIGKGFVCFQAFSLLGSPCPILPTPSGRIQLHAESEVTIMLF